MTQARAHLSAAAAICRRDILLFTSYRSRPGTTVFTTAVSLTLFYYVSRLVHSNRVGSPDDYYAFVVVGLATFAIVTATLATPIATLRAELQTGTFERMVVSPFGPVRSIASLFIFPAGLALLLGTISLTVGALVFGVGIRWPSALLGLPVAALAAVAFAPLGLAMAAAVVLLKQTNAGSTLVIAAITLLAGLYFPVSLLPGWIEWASYVQPFTPAVDLLRHLVVGTALRDPAWLELLKLVGFAVVMLPVAAFLLRAAVRLSRGRGTLIEY